MFKEPLIPRLVWPVMLLCLGLAGCGGRLGPGTSPDPPAPPPTQAQAAGELAGENVGEHVGKDVGVPVTVRIVDQHEFAKAVAQHRGKVVLVDLWATWCPSCLELFPHTVELARRFGDRGLVVISLSMDDPESQPQVLQTLSSHAAAFENFISRYGASDKSAEAFGLEDLVLPKFLLYDRQGNLHTTLRSSQGPIRAEDVDRAVEELLGQAEAGPARGGSQ